MSQLSRPQPTQTPQAIVVAPGTVVSEPKRFSALSLRALLIGIVCVVITCVVVCYAELVITSIQIGFLQLPPAVVGMLVLVLALQALATRYSARLRLLPHELFTIYVMMLLASMVSSRGLLEKLIPLLLTPNYFANTTNNWSVLFFKHIPKWAVPFDPADPNKQKVASMFFDSMRPGERVPWQLWVVPLAAWGVFVALIFGAFLCLAVILRRQWVDNEKLSFPLVQLPLEMVRTDAPGGSFLKNKITWFGFALPAFVFGFNGLHQMYPSVPQIVTDLDLGSYLVVPPYNAVGYFHLWMSFAAIGFFYLLPTDLLFSLWFFFALLKTYDVMAASMGYQIETIPLYMPNVFVGYQIIGCYFVLVGYMLYAARPHLARVWRAAWRNPFKPAAEPESIGSEELLSYRTAFWGLVACILLSAGWLTLLGMAYWLALFELAIMLFVVALVMARSTSESGMLMTETSFRPSDVYRMIGDVRNLGGANLTSMAFLDAVWMRDQRGLLLTGFLDSMKFADGVRVRRRSLLGVIVLGLLVALAVSGYLHVTLPYHRGGVTMYGYVYQGNNMWAFNDAATVLNRARPPLPWTCTLNFFIGAFITVIIASLRTRLMWFPLHPLGYALCGSWTMAVFWFAALVAWGCKVLILRYGGMSLYARARPFFLGMVLGEFTLAVLWTLPSVFAGSPLPAPTFPWP